MIGQKTNLTRKILTHLAAIGIFLTITIAYFYPEFQGKVLSQSDMQQFQGMSHELKEYYEEEGVSSAWTGTMFSGMPAYLIGIWGPNPNKLHYIETSVKLLGANSAGAVFTGMLTAYIMFTILGFGFMPSVLGAIGFSFCSYNIIILEAGHVTKAWVIAYIPLIVLGMLVLFQKKYLMGGVLMAIGLAFQIKNNHLQITYYTGLLCLFIFVGFIFHTIRQKEYKELLKASGFLAAGVTLAVLSNLFNIYSTLEMSEESIRGKSELTQPTETEKQSSGLDKEYAFHWSYGKAETFSLLIPNIHGGASSGFDDKTKVYKELINCVNSGVVPEANANNLYQQLRQYWGDQPFTSGPVYIGAIICFLFVLGMVLINNNLKWVLLAACIFFVFLSWGRHFDAFNDFFFYHFPLYNKFRAVAMALVIPSFIMVFIAAWGLKDFFDKDTDNKKRIQALYYSAALTGGICLMFWLAPSAFFNFATETETQLKSQLPALFSALVEDRKEMLSSDAFRSLIFIILAAGILFVSTKNKHNSPINTLYFMTAIAILTFADLWMVDKRYLNDKNYSKKIAQSQQFPQSEADKLILQDKSPSYRVLNLAYGLDNVFNDASTSYHHKSIGGYHAAKLKRYQELIEYHLAPEIREIAGSFESQDINTILETFKGLPALNMLNMKYMIFNPQQAPIENPYRMGNAWFVSDYKLVNNADEEIAAIKGLIPSKTAIIDKKFEQDLSGLKTATDSTATIEMTLYKPDRVSYKSNSKNDQLVVFSEVYYPHGWEAYIDGKPVPHWRANWILRSMHVPAGEHEIEFKFIPHQYLMSRTISTVSSIVLILMLVGLIVYPFIRKEKANTEEK